MFSYQLVLPTALHSNCMLSLAFWPANGKTELPGGCSGGWAAGALWLESCPQDIDDRFDNALYCFVFEAADLRHHETAVRSE